MKTIPLTRGAVAIVNDEDHADIARRNWSLGSHGYACRTEVMNGVSRMVLMHRQIISAPDGVHVDHANRVKLDNRRENLRLCTPTENQRNSCVRTGRRYKGAYPLPSGRYESKIEFAGRSQHLGCYDSEEEAARVYDAAARRLFGEFARPNFPQLTD